MHHHLKIVLGALALLLLAGAGLYEYKGPIKTTAATDWQVRADAWFDSADQKARKKQMRLAGRALKRACKHCHTKKFDGYTDKLDISRQMMAMAKEHGVQCADCHGGHASMTKMGEKAREMWALSHKRGVFCEACHEPNTQFKTLTEAGKKYDAEHPQPPKPAEGPAPGFVFP
jgi:RNase P subunit RPR2